MMIMMKMMIVLDKPLNQLAFEDAKAIKKDQER